MDLVGPNGENLTTDPLQARVKLVEEGRGLFKDIVKNAFIKGEGYTGDKKLIAQGAAMSVQNLELNQAQLDSLTVYYDKQIESLKKQKEATSDKEKQKRLEQAESDKQYRAEQAYARKRQQESSKSDFLAIVGLIAIIVIGILIGA